MTTLAQTNTSVLSEFVGGSTPEVAMMIGIGLVKESDAVFFQYMGEDQKPNALMLPMSGKPLTRMANVKLAGIDIAEEVGEFNSTKLNLYLQSSQGNIVMLTSGLTTIWSQCIITGLMGLFSTGNLEFAFQLDSWKGTSKMRPCFAAIRSGDLKISDQDLYDQLAEARSNRDKEKVNDIMRDSVSILKQAISLNEVEVAVVDNPDTNEF